MSECGAQPCDIRTLAEALQAALNKIVSDYNTKFKEAIAKANSPFLLDGNGDPIKDEDGLNKIDPDYIQGPLDGIIERVDLLGNSNNTYRERVIERVDYNFQQAVLDMVESLSILNCPGGGIYRGKLMGILFGENRHPRKVAIPALQSFLQGGNIDNNIGSIAGELEGTIGNCCAESFAAINAEKAEEFNKRHLEWRAAVDAWDAIPAHEPKGLRPTEPTQPVPISPDCVPTSICPFIEQITSCFADIKAEIIIEDVMIGLQWAGGDEPAPVNDPCHILLTITLSGADAPTPTPFSALFIVGPKTIHLKDAVNELKKGAKEAANKIKELIDNHKSNYMEQIKKADSLGGKWKTNVLQAFKNFQGSDALSDAIGHLYFEFVNNNPQDYGLDTPIEATVWKCMIDSFNEQRDAKERCLNQLHRTNQNTPKDQWPVSSTTVVPDDLPPNWASMTQDERIAWANSNRASVLNEVRNQDNECFSEENRLENGDVGNQQCCDAEIVDNGISVGADGTITVDYRFPPSNLWGRDKTNTRTVPGCNTSTIWDMQQGITNLLNQTMLPGCDKSALEGLFINNTESRTEPYKRGPDGKYTWPIGTTQPPGVGAVNPTDCKQIPIKLPRQFREATAMGLFFLTDIMAHTPVNNTTINKLNNRLNTAKDQALNINIDNIITETCN